MRDENNKREFLQLIKESFNYDFKVFIDERGKNGGYLQPIRFSDINSEELINTLKIWREENFDAYPSQFPVSIEGTRRWLIKNVLNTNGKILFMLFNSDNVQVGHMGIANYSEKEKIAEMDNIVRGEKEIAPGIISQALYDLITWTFLNLNVTKVYLRVFKDNLRAIKLYENLNFRETKVIPLKEIIVGDGKRFDEIIDSTEPDRYFSYMELSKASHYENYLSIKKEKNKL